MKDLRRASERFQHAVSRLPKEIRAADDHEVGLTMYEVVLAYNLDPPNRWTQAYVWLDVLAASEQRALAAAREAVLSEGSEFEETGLLRPSGMHRLAAGRVPTRGNDPIPVRWDVPVIRGRHVGSIVREPIYGMRLGFMADLRTTAYFLSEDEQREFALLVRKPVPHADPVCLCPWVYQPRM
jgi:hypothetical protein